jgi:hypothetical protein
MMPGPFAAKTLVTQYFKDDLPSRIIKFRNHWNLSAEELPLPLNYEIWAPNSLEFMDGLPSLYTIILSTRSMVREGYTTTLDPIYNVTYVTRTYVWVKNDNRDLTIQARDGLMTVMRTAMLDRQCLRKWNDQQDHQRTAVMFDEGTLNEEFSDLTPQKGQRSAAGGYLEYNMTVQEIVSRDFIGTVDNIEFEGDVLVRE